MVAQCGGKHKQPFVSFGQFLRETSGCQQKKPFVTDLVAVTKGFFHVV